MEKYRKIECVTIGKGKMYEKRMAAGGRRKRCKGREWVDLNLRAMCEKRVGNIEKQNEGE